MIVSCFEEKKKRNKSLEKNLKIFTTVSTQFFYNLGYLSKNLYC